MTAQFVQVKSAWLSKINWTAAVAAALTLVIALGLPISAETRAQILTITGVAVPLVIGILRTFFTSTVTPGIAAT